VVSLLVNTLVFSIWEYEIDQFNAKVRNFVVNKKFCLREFDEIGLPISYSARSRTTFISPFYVVHYGILYSNDLEHPKEFHYLWENDSFLKSWNVPALSKYRTFESFISLCDWVTEHVSYKKNKAHLLYYFDWYYENLQGKVIKAPWWSGLTDGYALLLLSRAYVLTGKENYRATADALYESVSSNIKDGGSLLNLPDGHKWIIEYVDTAMESRYLPRVLNGMIIATFGVYAYEKTFLQEKMLSYDLMRAIKAHVADYDLGWWTAYDAIGNVSNIKYHRIHLALQEDMYQLTGDEYYKILREKWNKQNMFFIGRNFIKSSPSISAWHMLFMYFVGIIVLLVLIYSSYIFVQKKTP
jgi:hypothetical protein